jgi:sulfide:quinone oxidoreductase
MLKGREWMAGPKRLPHEPVPHEAAPACDYEGRPATGKRPA